MLGKLGMLVTYAHRVTQLLHAMLLREINLMSVVALVVTHIVGNAECNEIPKLCFNT